MDDAPIEPERQAPWRALVFPVIWVLIIGAVFIAGKFGVLPSAENLLQRVGAYAGSVWGLPLLVLVFCVGAFLGAPQFALMAGAILAFGPWMGGLYAWLATLCSGTLTFWAGRFGGERLFARYGADGAFCACEHGLWHERGKVSPLSCRVGAWRCAKAGLGRAGRPRACVGRAWLIGDCTLRAARRRSFVGAYVLDQKTPPRLAGGV